MGMGSAYAAGAGMIEKQDSYVPLMRSYTDMAKVRKPIYDLTLPKGGGMGRRPSYSRGSRGGGTDYYAIAQQKRARQIEQDKQMYEFYGAGLSGSTPAPTRARRPVELQTSNQYEGEDLEKQKWRERQGKMDRAEDEYGLKERRDEREQRRDEREQGRYQREITEKDMEIDKEKRTEDFDNMMKAFLTGDYNEVAAYFIRYGTPGDDKNLSYPIIEPTDDPSTVLVTWPGRGEPELMRKDVLGELFVRMNPKFEERPKRKRAKKGTSRKDAAKAAANYAKGVSKDDPDLYEEAYREEYERIMSGDTQAQGEKTVVRRQRNRATGQVRITYSDGTTEIQ